MRDVWPNKPTEPTAVGAFSSAIAVNAARKAWLSFLRQATKRDMKIITNILILGAILFIKSTSLAADTPRVSPSPIELVMNCGTTYSNKFDNFRQRALMMTILIISH